MKNIPGAHHRRSIRLQEYDYSRAGVYFVTIGTHNRDCLLGDIVKGAIRLNDSGRIVVDEWNHTPALRTNILLDEFVVMPNHIHGIVMIAKSRRGVLQYAPTNSTPLQSPSQTIGAIVRGFKSAVTKQINELHNTPGSKFWQRNYWEHIIRNESELNRIRAYIQNNPAKWEMDRLNINRDQPVIHPYQVREPSAEYGTEPWMI